MSVTLADEDFETIKAALAAADELCTGVIMGRSDGQQARALGFARALNELKLKKIISNKLLVHKA